MTGEPTIQWPAEVLNEDGSPNVIKFNLWLQRQHKHLNKRHHVNRTTYSITEKGIKALKNARSGIDPLTIVEATVLVVREKVIS